MPSRNTRNTIPLFDFVIGHLLPYPPINTVRVAASFESPKKTPHPAVSTIQRAAGIKLIITVTLPLTIGTEGGVEGGGPA
jgi:hypothetical protein